MVAGMRAQEMERLPRLDPGLYRGRACVHWAMSLDRRTTGWLAPLLHLRLREALLHACCRYGLVCPAYVLMPDHGHFLLIGTGEAADQRLAMRMFRRLWSGLLPRGHTLQRQAYDHVLREEERACDAFSAVAYYILENPVRAGLTEEFAAWEYSGCCVPGYPSLDPRQPGYWESFWLALDDLSK